MTGTQWIIADCLLDATLLNSAARIVERRSCGPTGSRHLVPSDQSLRGSGENVLDVGGDRGGFLRRSGMTSSSHPDPVGSQA